VDLEAAVVAVVAAVTTIPDVESQPAVQPSASDSACSRASSSLGTIPQNPASNSLESVKRGSRLLPLFLFEL
jgi:hypothetical protein